MALFSTATRPLRTLPIRAARGTGDVDDQAKIEEVLTAGGESGMPERKREVTRRPGQRRLGLFLSCFAKLSPTVGCNDDINSEVSGAASLQELTGTQKTGHSADPAILRKQIDSDPLCGIASRSLIQPIAPAIRHSGKIPDISRYHASSQFQRKQQCRGFQRCDYNYEHTGGCSSHQ